MYQNRVDPFGNFIATKARGKWLGNRGQLHGKGKVILRPFKHKAWISCLLEFKGRHREIMAPNLWTELFFMDEATAMAAGHRPCFECRREAANLFKTAFIKGNPGFNFDLKTPIGKIDEVLQKERIAINGAKVTFKDRLNNLPNGTFIAFDSEPYLVKDKIIYPWSAFGYKSGLQLPLTTMVNVLTPKSIVNALTVGYQVDIDLVF